MMVGTNMEKECLESGDGGKGGVSGASKSLFTKLRFAVFWCHLSLSLIAGLVIFIMCLTGAITAFECQIINWMERDVRARPGSADALLLAPGELIARAAKASAEPLKPFRIEWSAAPDIPVRIQCDKNVFTLVNGYSGEVLGHGATGTRAFLRWASDVHVRLGLAVAGGWIVSIANVCFVWLLFSGLWLWWPGRWSPAAFRNSIVLRLSSRGKARDWNWHNVAGFWFLLPLLVISVTGMAISFRPVNDWWCEVASRHFLEPSVPATKLAQDGDAPDAGPGWSACMRLLQERYPGYRSIATSKRLLPDKKGIYEIDVHTGTPRERRATINVKLNAVSGRLLEESGWSGIDPSQRARALVRTGHTGEILGIAGQFVCFAACMAGCLLVWTGLALSWRRLVSSIKA